MTKENQRVCVVGDDAQSIYSFRGADIDNILYFTKIYPNTKVFKLEQNYRSTQTIVCAANSLIEKNERQIRKEVFSEKGYKDASMREIASRTGITVSNIYHYFTNKDEIFRTILKPVLNDLYVKIYRHDANQMSIEVFTNSDYQQESVQEYIDLVSEHRARLRMLLFQA